MFFTAPGVLAGTLYPKLFAMLQSAVSQLRADDAPYDAYLELAANVPSPMGGVAADHLTERQVRSRARQLQLFDPACLDDAIDGKVFASFDPTKPITCPVTLLAANEAYGGAFLAGTTSACWRSPPRPASCPSRRWAMPFGRRRWSAARFLDELDAFVTTNS